MKLIQQISLLLLKDLRLEWRQKYAVSGILLYVLSTVFVVYVAAGETTPEVWNSLFWIVSLFASVNAIVKSFVQENSARALYYYVLFNPIAVILSKIIYNFLLLFLLIVVAYGAFIFFIGNPILQFDLFFTALLLGSLGLSTALTFISAIASKANNSASLMAILAFPVIIPILLAVVQLSSYALQEVTMANTSSSIGNLIAIDLVLLAVSMPLFPYLWRD